MPGSLTESPMFPLGTVLIPGAVLPLHVFEPRYRDLVRHCLDDESEFGVVLIARGHEVGGGDVRSDVGCLARIESFQETPDGRFGIMCVGTERVKVLDWLEDDPYPRATVERWPDEGGPAEPGDLADRAAELTALLRRTLALGSEAGLRLAPATAELSEDPETLSFQAAALAPLGPLDRYGALCEPTTSGRIDALMSTIAAAREVIELQLTSEPDTND